MFADGFLSAYMFEILGLLVTIAGIWFVVQQLRESKLASQMEGILMLQDHWERIIEDRGLLWDMTMTNDDWDTYSAKMAYKAVYDDKDVRDSFLRVANFFDTIGTLVIGKSLDKKLAYHQYNLVLCPLYDKFEIVLSVDRKAQKNARIFENWEWIRKEFKKMDG